MTDILSTSAPTPSPNFRVLYQNEAFVAIDKPTQWFVHRSAFDRQADQIILQPLRDQLGQYLYPVHRLDRPTSGVLLFAFTQTAANHLAAQFRENHPIKIYHAIVRGYAQPHATLDAPLQRELGNGEVEMQDALTHYHRLNCVELPIAVPPYESSRYALLEVQPITGRMHQIRRHLNYAAYPIIGDSSHGDLRHNRSFAHHLGIERLWLHATHLTLLNPLDDQPLTITAPWSSAWQSVMAKFQWPIDQDDPQKSHFLTQATQS